MATRSLTSMSVAELKRRKYYLMKKLRSQQGDLLRGSVIERYSKCGKDNCHCVKDKGHGPKYYLSVSYANSRPKLYYIPKDKLPSYRQRIGNLDNLKSIMNEISDVNIELMRR